MTHTEHSHTDTPEVHEPIHEGHRGHSGMMVACCIPMLLIAVVLVATNVVSVGFLFYALACLGMMFMMMRMMDRSGMKM